MKIRVEFEGSDRVVLLPNATAVPRIGDSVELRKGGCHTVIDVAWMLDDLGVDVIVRIR